MNSLTIYEKNTDYRTIIVRVKDPRKILAQLFLQLPNEIGADYPEGDKSQQIERLIDFIIEQFPTISVADIRRALELNDGQKFTRHVQHYGRLDRAFMGSVLGEFVNYRVRKKGVTNQPSEVQNKNIKALLINDLTSLKLSPKYEISQHIDEKFNYLAQHVEEFSEILDADRLKTLTREYGEKIEAGRYAWISYGENLKITAKKRAELFAIDKMRAENVTDWLKNQVLKSKLKT